MWARPMGEVLIRYRVMPDGADVDLDGLQDRLKAALPDCATAQSFDVKPFAFGLKVLETSIIIEDEEGNNDLVEDALRGLESVQGIELIEMGRL